MVCCDTCDIFWPRVKWFVVFTIYSSLCKTLGGIIIYCIIVGPNYRGFDEDVIYIGLGSNDLWFLLHIPPCAKHWEE